MVKPPVEYGQASDQSSVEKTRISFIVPLVILAVCFLLLLGVFMYQRRLLQNYRKQQSNKPQPTKENCDSIQIPAVSYKSMERVQATQESAYVNEENPYATAYEVLGGDEPTGQDHSPYMTLKDNQEPPNVYQPLQLPDRKGDLHHTKASDQAMQYQNAAFNVDCISD